MEAFGDYHLLGKLATGGMAQVFLARTADSSDFSDLLVVKRILPHLAENQQFVRMFLHEARIAARLHHPNIAEIRDLGHVGGAYFIAMEYIHGEDFRRVVRQASQLGRELPLPLACRIVADACAGLHFAHEAVDAQGRPLDIVHRDISPQNLLVTFEGQVKVIDFGVAKAADSTERTRTGVLKGKYAYMSPEQAHGERIDRRSDVFALGIVLFELLTRARLFKRNNDVLTLQAVMDAQVPPPRSLNPDIPPSLESILLRALAADREQRTPTANELRAGLELVLSDWGDEGSHTALRAFMQDVYADRLATEERLGHPLVDFSLGESALRPIPTAFGAQQRAATSPPPASNRVPRLPDPMPWELGTGIADPAGDATQAGPAATDPHYVPRQTRPESTTRPIVQRDAEATPVPATRPPTANTVAVTGSSAAQPPAPTRRGRIALAAGLVVFALAGGLWVWKRRAPAPSGQGTTAEAATPEGSIPTASAQVGAFKLESSPSGATVIFDGRKLADVTPTMVSDLPAHTTHEVVLSLDGHTDVTRTVQVEAGRTLRVQAELGRLAGPAGDAKAVAPTPVSLPGTATNTPIPRPAEKAAETRLPTRGASSTTAAETSPAPMAMGRWSLTTQPPGLLVELDGRPVGRTPVTEAEATAGPHRLRVVDPEKLLEDVLPFTLGAGERRSIDRTYVARKVRFNVKPFAKVVIDGREFAESPGDATMYPGTYVVTYTCPEIQARRTSTLVIPSGEGVHKVQFELQPGEGTP